MKNQIGEHRPEMATWSGGSGGRLIPVSLAVDPKCKDGTGSTRADYVYRATSLIDGSLVAEEISPYCQRMRGSVAPAMAGLCVIYDDAPPILIYADECFRTAAVLQ